MHATDTWIMDSHLFKSSEDMVCCDVLTQPHGGKIPRIVLLQTSWKLNSIESIDLTSNIVAIFSTLFPHVDQMGGFSLWPRNQRPLLECAVRRWLGKVKCLRAWKLPVVGVIPFHCGPKWPKPSKPTWCWLCVNCSESCFITCYRNQIL